MPRARTIVALVGGALVALSFGLIPSELVARLRSWAAEGKDEALPQAEHSRRQRPPTRD
jgi:hypothetical protein